VVARQSITVQEFVVLRSSSFACLRLRRILHSVGADSAAVVTAVASSIAANRGDPQPCRAVFCRVHTLLGSASRS